MSERDDTKILITGGLGYLGCVLAKHLLAKGYKVTILDMNLYDQFYDSNILSELKGAIIINGDIRDEQLMQKLINDNTIVIHLAAIVGDAACDLDKELAVKINYLATRKIAELVGKENKKLIFSSTCSVYGASFGGPLTEKSEVNPLSIYAITKLAAEEAIKNIVTNHIILRFGTLFGLSPRMRFDLVINRFVGQALQDGFITVFGGQQKRPFLHVQDAAEAIVNFIELNKTGLFNVGGINYSIIDVASQIQKYTGCKLIIYEEIKDPRNYVIDSSLALNLGVKFNRTIEYGIKEIIRAFKEKRIVNYRDKKYNNVEFLKNKLGL
jgi:nucleoside-diphosphate-sugar epimerase